MVKVLLITVGGKSQPIITAIRKLHPERVIFFCSSGKGGSLSKVLGPGKPCRIFDEQGKEKSIPNIPTYLKLGERFDKERDVVELEDPDSPSECYQKVSLQIRKLQSQGNEILADYTGGTKTMSLALGMAAMDYGIKLFLTSRPRIDTDQIKKGEFTRMISTELIDLERRIEQFLPKLLRRYDYPAAIAQLENLLQSIPLSTESRTRIYQLLDYCKAFEAWDRFDHITALQLLEPFYRSPVLKPIIDFLKRVMHSRDDIDTDFSIERFRQMNYHGYEVVEDLLLNAARRAEQRRYDDAVGRLYRALELLMQVHLYKRYEITTEGVAPEQLVSLLPEASHEKFQHLLSSSAPQVRFGVTRGYELLSHFTDDPLGEFYSSREKKIAAVIKIRNFSLFAHGFRPVSEDDYKAFHEVVELFIQEAIGLLCHSTTSSKWQQFPMTLPLLTMTG